MTRTLRPRLAACATLLLALSEGCSRSAARTHVQGPNTASRRPLEDARAEAFSGPSNVSPALRARIRELEAARCHDGSCCATELTSIGAQRQWVVAIENQRECLLGERTPRGAVATPPSEERSESEASAESEDEPSAHACTEYWLLNEAAPPRKLDAACDDDKWEGHFELDGPNEQLTYYGSSLFSSLRIHDERVLGLNPVRWLEVRHGAQDAESSREEHWSWERFAGEVTLGIDFCKPAGAAPDAAVDSDGPAIEVRVLKIPRLALPSAVAADWPKTRLESCAARAGGDTGFLLTGDPKAHASSAFSLLFVEPTTLLVEIRDDHFVGRERANRIRDELEILTASPQSRCAATPATTRVSRFSVGVLDGVVHSNRKEVPAPIAELARSEGVVRLKLAFPPSALGARLTVVYRDTDDGRAFQRVLATSELDEAKWWTLGELPQNADDLSCELVSGTLMPVAPEPPRVPGGMEQ